MRAVYVIAPEAGDVLKIGLATDPAARRGGLQGSRTDRLRVEFSLSTCHAARVERIAHRILKDHRVSGEWFAVPLEQARAAIYQAVLEAEAEALREPLSFASITRLWPKRADLARDLGTYDGLVQQWMLKDFIPCEWWQALVGAAARRGIEGVTLEVLAELAQRRRLAAADEAA